MSSIGYALFRSAFTSKRASMQATVPGAPAGSFDLCQCEHGHDAQLHACNALACESYLFRIFVERERRSAARRR